MRFAFVSLDSNALMLRATTPRADPRIASKMSGEIVEGKSKTERIGQMYPSELSEQNISDSEIRADYRRLVPNALPTHSGKLN
jgi:hypothetical protein